MAEPTTVLVVGGGHAEIPLIDALHELGHEVVTTGNRPDDRGHPHADRYVGADFSDRDAIRDLAADLGVGGMVSGCNDFAAMSTSYAAMELGLPGHDSYDVYLRIHHKDRFRALLEEIGLPTPGSGVVRSPQDALELCDRIGFPVIVKPVDLTGGKGMTVCRTAAELAPACERALSATRQDHVVVEQFMEGTRHGFTCFVVGGRVTFWFADDEQYFRNQFLVSGTTTPTSMPDEAVVELVAAVERITDHLRAVDGLMHVQCILTDGGPRIVELCRRCPGDLYPWFVRLSTDYDYAGAVVRSELGLEIPAPTGTSRPITRHCLMGEREGVLRDVSLDAEVRSRLVEQMLWWRAGQDVTNHLVDKFGIVFLGFPDVAEMRRLTAELPDRIEVRIDPEDRGAAEAVGA